MIIESLIVLFNRDLNTLKSEIESYTDETTLWKVEHSIKNSAGNLCLHLIGNLKTYIGNGLTKSEYIRNRDFEFSAKFVPRTEILQQIEETRQMVYQGLNNLTEAQLTEDFPIIIWEKETEMVYTLIHLHSHLNYHLGQINYHRRLLSSR